ncbi:hypothetical protein THRCLA_06802 [Thraustotheca clavata]|uniref:WRKY19-like zinc finger domain-containing protein n=1 Tax=Thraustotheca clavata TaxID=74557 RepID=A0A1V9ZJ81_9STRA|nr:hypothetical protein THRCLA_06802 [Thraustotheca clavata]
MAFSELFTCAEIEFLVNTLDDGDLVQEEEQASRVIQHDEQFRCLDPTCSSIIAWKRGYCSKHGNRRRCSMEGCSRGPQAGGLCIRHGGGRRCRQEKCTKAAQTMGLCKAHGGGIRCQANGCTKSSQSGGFCRRHGGGKQCAIPGCPRGVQRRQYCFLHRFSS